MTRHRYVPEYHDPILRRLIVRWKRTDMQAANEMGFTVMTIKKAREALGLPYNERPKVQFRAEKDPPAPPEKPNPVALAIAYLGSRLEEKPSGYWLDGHPVSLDTLMKACNRVRVGMGMEQITCSEKWRV